MFLVVDGWGTLRQEYEELEGTVTTLASRGLGFGVHVIITAARWAEIRINLRDMLGTRLELRLGDPGESELDRKAAANVPEKTPGRGISREKLHVLSAVPAHRRQAAGRRSGRGHGPSGAAGARGLAVPARAPGPAAAPTPAGGGTGHAGRAPTAPGIPIGINETKLAPVRLDFASDPHFYAFGDAECGKTNLLRLIARTIVERYSSDEAMLVIADYRRGLLGTVEGKHLLGYAPSGQVLTEMVGAMQGALTQRIPGPNVTADQLRNRSWWTGPEIYLLVDDYDLVAGGGSNPLSDPGRAAAAGARHRPARHHHPAGRWRLARALRPGDPTHARARQPRLPDVGQQGGGGADRQPQAQPAATRAGHAGAAQRRHAACADRLR